MILVLDTSAFFAGLEPLALRKRAYTVPEVMEELKEEYRQLKARLAQESGLLEVRTPQEKYMQLVKKAATQTGDVALLSRADMAVLALALEFASQGEKVTIVTDDYAVQNVAKFLKLRFSPVMEQGIRRRFRWYKRCVGCGRRYSASYASDTCEVCGAKVKARVKRR
jgi:UPF0271 protein